MRVVIAGGGTAGHVYPGLAVARELRARGAEVSFLGTDTGVESRLVPAAGFSFEVLRARPLVRRVSIPAARAPFVAAKAVRACRPMVRGADAVVGMGGYVSVPAVLAARREGIPVVLHEQNAVLGLANRALVRMRAARAVALSFADAAPRFGRGTRTVVTGNPIREDIVRVPEERDTLAKEGRTELDLDERRRTVVVFGGSQGALHIDRAAVGACRILGDRSDMQIVLITGPAHLEVIRRGLPLPVGPAPGAAGASPESVPPEGVSGDVLAVTDGSGGLLVRLVGYLDRMELAYACADLVVSRAGATTIAEVSVCALPALLVPYPHATARHQERNARAMQRAGAASVMGDDQLSAQSMADRVASLVDDRERLEAMRERSRAFGKPDAAGRLADLIVDVAGVRG